MQDDIDRSGECEARPRRKRYGAELLTVGASCDRIARRGEETGARLGVGATQKSRAVLASGDVHVGAGSSPWCAGLVVATAAAPAFVLDDPCTRRHCPRSRCRRRRSSSCLA